MPRVFRRGKWSGAPVRRVGGRRRPLGRRAVVGRGRIPGVKQPVQYFKRTDYLSGAITASSLADTFGTYVFSLAQIPDVSDFTNLYDQYQIKMVKWTIIPRGNSMDVQTGLTTGQNMGVFSVLDYDDNTTPTTLDELMQYQNMRMTRSTQQHKRVLRPKLRNAVVGSAGVIANGNNTRHTWIDCNNTTVPHYGIKYALQQLPNGSQIYDLKVDYYLAFKNVR